MLSPLHTYAIGRGLTGVACASAAWPAFGSDHPWLAMLCVVIGGWTGSKYSLEINTQEGPAPAVERSAHAVP